MPTCWIVAGPNGAGKTTFALEFLPDVVGCQQFINADLIAAGLSPLAPERELVNASRIFLAEIRQCIQREDDFAFETTLSGRSYLKLIKELQEKGWVVELLYLALPSAEFSRLRVDERVAHGGHNIPTKDIQRRFPRSLANLLNDFSYQVDHCQCYFNAGDAPELVFDQRKQQRNIHNQALFNFLIREAAL